MKITEIKVQIFIFQNSKEHARTEESTAVKLSLKGHTLGFYPQIQKREPPCTA